MKRRDVLKGAGLLAACALGAFVLVEPVAADPATITPKEAHARVKSGEIMLIDIRNEPEWRDSGVPKGAHAISMNDNAFINRIEALTGGAKDAKIAVICARGVRSARVRARLEEKGYSQIIDVSQGMFGNAGGSGWVKQGLPVEAYSGKR